MSQTRFELGKKLIVLCSLTYFTEMFIVNKYGVTHISADYSDLNPKLVLYGKASVLDVRELDLHTPGDFYQNECLILTQHVMSDIQGQWH